MIMMYPHLGVNVKKLFLEGYEGDSTDIYRFFSDIIPLLPNITYLGYDSLPIPYLHLPLFSSGLLSLTSLKLIKIKADSFGDFVRFVSFHKHLKELTIIECSWKRSSVHHYSFGVRWGRDLQKLSFVYCEYEPVFDILRWLGRSNSPCSIQCLEMRNVMLSEKPVVPFIAEHLAIQWATTMKAIRLEITDEIAKAGDDKEAVVSSLTAYIRFCPNLHTVKLYIPKETLWVVRQLPDVLSSLVSLRRLGLWFESEAEAEDILLGDNEKAWTTLDEDLGDSAKFRFLEYVRVLCVHNGERKAPPWWENDSGSSEDGESDSGREPNGEEGETESREECSSTAIESLRGEKGKQRQEIPWGAELTSYELTDLHATMNRVALYHRRKKPLTDIFPRLSKRGVLWCSIANIHNRYALQVTASNLVGMESRNWRPRYCRSTFLQPLDYS
ncbi:hypothetical protein NLI96_g11021 [Meripilus lineatus]|uniref:Uncharacterized protein n=1 Tax=Meripilus lineatus TaxID=2056292 RepID=A0AAD5UU07_9APHY|nr:hypothetical protein NLI96_g11021 [Physisporinus lineatus]